MNAIALYCLVKSTWIYLIYFFILFQINELLDHVDGELARVKRCSSKLGSFLEYLVDIPGSAMFGFFGLCAAIAVYRQTNDWIIFCIFMSIPMGISLKESFRRAFKICEEDRESTIQPRKWLGIMKNKNLKERIIIIAKLFIAWENHLILWSALLYWPIKHFFGINPLFWAIVVIGGITQLRWIRTVYIGYKIAYKEQGDN